MQGSSDGGTVIVIGAGAAGLSAAYHLSRAGRPVIVVEARASAGGRILTDHVDGAVVELGAEFIHGTPRATLELLRAEGSAILPFEGDHWQFQHGKLVPMGDSSSGLHRLMALARSQQGDRSVESFLEEISGDAQLRESATWMRNLLQGFDGADPKRASLKAIIEEWSGNASTAAEQGRPAGGYGPLVDYMVGRLDPSLVELRFGVAVDRVRWSRSGATVFAGGDAKEAKAVVITVPLSILQLVPCAPSAIAFDPPLDAKSQALAGLAMGPVHRVALRFASPVWESPMGGPVPAGTFMHAPGQPFPTFWTSDPESPWLVAWCGGPPAARVGELDDAGIMEQAVVSARAMFPGASVEEVRFHNWQRDPFSLGAYSYVTVGGGAARRELAMPLDGMLYFAGEATDASGEAATVAGALASGARAARQVMGKGRD
jgi:monoamine oxidase